MTKKILTDLDATGRTITSSAFAGTYFGTETGTIGSNKNTWLGGTSGTSQVTSGVTSTTSINNVYSVAGTVSTSIHGGYSIGSTGVSTINLGGYALFNAGAVSTINLGSTGTASITTTNIYGTTNFSGTTSPIQLNTSAGTSGQVLTSAGSGSTPTWSDKGYTLIQSIDFNGANVSFTSIPSASSGYKMLVLQVKMTSSCPNSITMTVNTSGNIAYTLYLVGSTTATVSTAGVSLSLNNGSSAANDIMVVEMPNWTSSKPLFRVAGVTASTNQARWGVGSSNNAVTQIGVSGLATSGVTGTAYLYGVN